MFKKILLLVFCLVFANVAFSQVFDQLEKIRENKVVRVYIKDEGTICIKHTPNEMHIAHPLDGAENDTSFVHYHIRDAGMSLDSVHSATKYAFIGDTLIDHDKRRYHYDSLSRLEKEEYLYDGKLQHVALSKYNQSGKLDTLLNYDIKGAFKSIYRDSLRLHLSFIYNYDSLGRKSEEIQYYLRTPNKRYIYDDRDRLIEIKTFAFDTFSEGRFTVDTTVYTYKYFEYYENGALKSSKSNDSSTKNYYGHIEERIHEKHYKYLENGLIKNETSIYIEDKGDWMKRFDHTYDYDFFTYDIYKPLDAENTKADTTGKTPVVENELTNLLDEFDWSAYPAYPTISVYHNLGESTLWVAKYAESDDDEKLEMFILGYHEKIEKKAFFGLGKKQIKERKNIYMAVGLDNVKMLYQLYFAGKIDELKSELRALDKEIKF